MSRRPAPTSAFVPLTVAALVALTLLATLQYHWVGQISAGERERRQANLTLSAQRLGEDFDRELARAYLSFQMDAATLRDSEWERFAARFDHWRQTAPHPGLVKAIYLVEVTQIGRVDLLRYDHGLRSFAREQWPFELMPIRRRIERTYRAIFAGGDRARVNISPVDRAGPALLIPVARPWMLSDQQELGFNADLLLSDEKDPAGRGSTNGAQEVYIVYRHTLDLAKIGGPALKFPGVRGSGITLGFDANTKTDAGYNSKKRMLVAGPTLFMDVPGFLNVGVLFLNESNAPYNTFTGVSTPRYTYKTHAMLTAAWGIPLSKAVPVSFEGFMNFIGSKGVNEFGGATKPETNIDAQVMLDVGALAGGAKGTFKVGIEYQYWKNKFGNPASGPAGKGAFAKTPMLRAEYHF